ncbi:uncharacterized protein LOC141607585 [Silene latifolia]|uniref:uncharacterized protein LOC141607585 n=1 Tax=Silene latifolia TaxID=37657 RepID=UPI003D772CC5
MKSGFVQDQWSMNGGRYTTVSGYEWLMGTQIQVPWVPVVWNRLNVPKHSFIAWVYVEQRLLTKDRLCKFGMAVPTECDMCMVHPETHAHLFFECSYSRACLDRVNEWLGVRIPVCEPIQWCLQLRYKSLMKKQVVFAAVCGLVYLIWWARNKCRLEKVLTHPAILTQELQKHVQIRYQNQHWRGKDQRQGSWITQIGFS